MFELYIFGLFVQRFLFSDFTFFQRADRRVRQSSAQSCVGRPVSYGRNTFHNYLYAL
jgi:hypothetical protein